MTELCYYSLNYKNGTCKLIYTTSVKRANICKKEDVLHTTGLGYNLPQALTLYLKYSLEENRRDITTKDEYEQLGIIQQVLSQYIIKAVRAERSRLVKQMEANVEQLKGALVGAVTNKADSIEKIESLRYAYFMAAEALTEYKS